MVQKLARMRDVGMYTLPRGMALYPFYSAVWVGASSMY